MHVRSLSLDHFLRHEGKTTLSMPERGIVTVTGPNESGKSSLVEAVSWGVWGWTLRGEFPLDGPGAVTIEADRCVVSRWVEKGRKVELAWRTTAGDPINEATFPTTTKAQEALERVVGDWETWCQTHVFSSDDAARWTLATDGERKRFVEGLLRYDFDGPLDRCRKALREAKEAQGRCEARLVEVNAGIVNQEQRLVENRAVLDRAVPDGPAPAPPAATGSRAEEIARLDVQIKGGEKLLLALRRKASDVGRVSAETEVELRLARDRWNKLRSGRCPTCHQEIGDALQDALRRAVSEAEAASAAGARLAEETRAAVEAELAEVQEEQSAFGREHAALQAAEDRAAEDARAWEADRRRREGAAAVRASAEKFAALAREALRALTEEKATLEASLAGYRVDVAVLIACEEVLGLRGVRAQVVARTLSGLEQAANVFLCRIARPGVAVRLRPYTEKKGGGVADSIAFEWRDGEAWRPYRTASSGARRRLDVALLLALAEVAAAASGNASENADLYCDEVFDALDSTGIGAVSSLLHEMAETRMIMVISHNPDLVGGLEPCTLRLRVENGTVSSY
jgi:DNA repair exonuclease SbcCD ATPase subunit